MSIETVSRLCTPNAVVTSDSLVEQVAQIEDLAHGRVDGREFFRRNHFTEGLQRLVERGVERRSRRTRRCAARWFLGYVPEPSLASPKLSFSMVTKIRRISYGGSSASSSVK